MSLTEPWATIVPASMMPMRVQSCDSSCRMWLEMRIVLPISLSALSSSRISMRARGSSPEAGSSRSSRSGSCSSTRASDSRCFIPRDRASTGALQLVHQVGQLEHVADDRLAAGAVDAVGRGEEVQVFFDRQVFVDAEEVGDVADLLAHRLRLPQDVDAVDLHPAGEIAEQRRQHLDGRRLARPVGADEPEHFPRGDLQRDAADGRQLPVAHPQAFHVDDEHSITFV